MKFPISTNGSKGLQSLQEEARQVSEGLKELGQKTYRKIVEVEAPIADAVSRAYDARQRQLMSHLDEMKKQADRGGKRFVRYAKSKPLQVASLALGVGLLIGLAGLGRTRR